MLIFYALYPMLYFRLFVNVIPVSKYLKNISFHKIFLNWYCVIYAVILKCDFLLPPVYVIFIVDRILYLPYIPVLSL